MIPDKISSDLVLSLQKQLAVIENNLATAEENNKQKNTYQAEYAEYQAKADRLRYYDQRVSFIYKGAMERVDKFRVQCLDDLERRVESILAVVYPDEDFKVSITFKMFRGAYQSEVLIGKQQADGTIKWGKPKSRNGEFMKQLVSFSMVASMNLLLGSKFLMMDEPFSSSDPNNVSLLKPVFEMMLENGLQILLIEHKENLFKTIDHNEILLQKHRHPSDEHKGYVEVVSIERKFSNDNLDAGPNGTDSPVQNR